MNRPKPSTVAGGGETRTPMAEGAKTDIRLGYDFNESDQGFLFSGARIVIGAEELAWSLTVPWGETPVAELGMAWHPDGGQLAVLGYHTALQIWSIDPVD